MDGNNRIDYSVTCLNENAFSLSIDKRSNRVIANILNVTDMLSDGDELFILCNIMTSRQLNWKNVCQTSHNKYVHSEPITKNYGPKEIASCVIREVFKSVDGLISPDAKLANGSVLEQIRIAIGYRNKTISEASLNKISADVITGQIAVTSFSSNSK